ncbi:transcription factor [Candidatus Bathyarchaeota archaeon]|nr:transcription factor [Candidatus Bathyarchaeota archaeon]
MFSLVDEEPLMKVFGLFGEEAIEIAKILMETTETTDDDIATKTEIRLNDIRKILYKLYSYSLIGLRRTRDKNTGWFIFHWRLQPDQLEGFILNKKRRMIEKFETRLEYEKNHDFYYCFTAGCRQIPFEEAMEVLFQCPVCEKSLIHFDNDQIIDAITKKIDQIQKELIE